MSDGTFEKRVKIQQIIENQLPEFLIDEFPKAVEFLKQYYISQEFQSGPIDISENLDQYLKLDNLTPEIIVESIHLTSSVSIDDDVIFVTSTKGFPNEYGLLKIDDEIITYTEKTENSFIGCIRGFSGITSYQQTNNPEELVFSTSKSSGHNIESKVINLSSLFLKEFYKKIKFTFTPGLENVDFISELNVGNFIKESNSLYKSKGTEESFRILFKVLYGVEPKIIDLERFLIKPSSAEYIRREIVLAEKIDSDRSSNPLNLVGQTIKRTKDPTTQASVSEIEILSRNNKTYYKLSLFVGFNDRDLIEGEFKVAGKTKALESIPAGSSIISVDSTIGFSNSGIIISGNNVITYSDKTINQFLGCSGINTDIPIASDIKSDETIYGYENGDLTKKVELRITGILSNFTPLTDISIANEGEKVYIKNLGDSITPPLAQEQASIKKIFANSWIYNTSCRYQISTFQPSGTIILNTSSDKTSLSIGDYVDILNRFSDKVLTSSPLRVEKISQNLKEITLSSFFQDPELDPNNQQLQILGYDPEKKYDIRRKIKFSSKPESEGSVELEYNGSIFANIQNVYVDNTSEYAYVSSNGLPEYPILINLNSLVCGGPDDGNTFLSDLNIDTQYFSSIIFNQVRFFTGDFVEYQTDGEEIKGLVSGSTYYIEVLSSNKIRLYTSKSFIGSENFVELRYPDSNDNVHRFVLKKYTSNLIQSHKNFKKFPLFNNINSSGFVYETKPGTVGMLVNGVEIISPKSLDKVYYGPIKKINILNSGDDYDVINPPKISISEPENGTPAFVQPTLNGYIKEIFVDEQNFDVIDKNSISVEVTGGNGSGVKVLPIISERYRDLEFDARTIDNGGGINITEESITFTDDHNLSDGEFVIYDSNGNNSIGVGTFSGGNEDTKKTLSNSSGYYVKILNSKSVNLYGTLSDYTVGINTVGFTTANTNGVHKFRTISKYTLKEIKVLDSGSGYQNKILRVNPSGISTSSYTITFENHNFKDGDIVVYSYEQGENPITGLSTDVQYKVIKIDDNKFQIANIGFSTSIDLSNYTNKNYTKFTSQGTGYQIFKYPPIQVTVTGTFNNQNVSINAIPVVRGKIDGVYVYEPGTGYGSSIINFERQPIIKIESGKDAEVFPIIKNGKITKVNVNFGGYEYNSVPEFVISGTGSGAKLRGVIQNEKLVSVVVVSSGIGYGENTSIRVVSPGQNAKFTAKIRDLTINERSRSRSDEMFLGEKTSLKYGIISYPNNNISNPEGTVGISTIYLKDSFGNTYSPIIGWAYDGNPIYGPWATEDPNNLNSQIISMKSGYEFEPDNVFDRPQVSDNITFVEDYVFKNTGTLDKYNGRFTKTLEFPNGTYAYYATIDPITFQPTFPYFIGKEYKSPFIEENNTLNQYFDFENSSLRRNTFPYCLGLDFVDNDFIVESNEIIEQSTVIDSVSKGTIESLEIISRGKDYKVGENIIFNNENTNGGGVFAKISEVHGKPITKIESFSSSFENCVFVWNKDFVSIRTKGSHNLIDSDSISISGISTNIGKLVDFYKIGVSTESTTLLEDIPLTSSGIVTDIYLSYIPRSVSVGSTISIENEELRVLNIFDKQSILRVKRSQSGVTSHRTSTKVDILPNEFSIPLKTDYFNSRVNSLVYFNPQYSLGVGTAVGFGTTTKYSIGNNTNIVFIPTQSIYLPNHPFITGQKVVFTTNGSSISVSNTSTSALFSLPSSGNSAEVYVISKSKDFIGITTLVGLTTNTSGLFFRNNQYNNYEYSLESKYEQVTGNVNKIKATVSVSTSHNLRTNDVITLNVEPNTSVGIGTSSEIRVFYNSNYDKILINPIKFNSTAVNVSANTISLQNHQLKTGDKVFYEVSPPEAVITGLSTGGYYVYKLDSNTIKLGQTFYDVTLDYPVTIDFSSTGGNNQKISLINPKISITKNSNIVFNVSDSSLSEYDLQLFYDKNFQNNFISAADSEEFNVVSTASTVTIYYSKSLPDKLYYILSKNGKPLEPDIDVVEHSQIIYQPSVYNNSYEIVGVGETVFDICLTDAPEKNIYLPTDTSTLEYTTKSKTAYGGIADTKLIFGGTNYKKIPEYSRIETESGTDANIVAFSTSIGQIEKLRFLEQGFDYPSDNTLKPTAEISPILYIKDYNTISKVNVLYGGKNYVNLPSLLVYDVIENKILLDTSLNPILNSGSIVSVNLQISPKGLKNTNYKILTVNNSNGIGIKKIELTATPGIYKLELITPIAGYSSEELFKEGDEVFVEGILKEEEDKDGFNSSDYNYNFLKVHSYTNSIPATVEVDVREFTNDLGTPVDPLDNPNDFPTIVNKINYPEFDIVTEESYFKNGEPLLVLENNVFREKNLFVNNNKNAYSQIRISGTYNIKENQVIRGKVSGTVATITKIVSNQGVFEIDYSNKIDYGWISDTGKLNESYQVCPDNDYYQNLSYTVKSEIEFDRMIDPVNRLLHTSGLKNFADTEVKSSVGIGITFSTSDITVLDVLEEKRVDTINNFDEGTDINFKINKTKFVKLKYKKISDYFKCLTNRVITIDDISEFFDDTETNQTFFNQQYAFIDYISNDFSRYLIQIIDPDNNEISLNEFILIAKGSDSYLLQKSLLSNTEQNTLFGDLIIEKDDKNDEYIKFVPFINNLYEKNYDIKILKTFFEPYNSGISTSSFNIGFVNVSSYQNKVGYGKTSEIISFNKNQYGSFFASILVKNTVTQESNYIDFFVSHDGADVFSAESYFDTGIIISQNILGKLEPSISGNRLILNFYNNESNDLVFSSKIIGFGLTSINGGGDVYRFLSSVQIPGNEESANIITEYDNTNSGIGTAITIDKTKFSSLKSLVRVSYGQTSALHQISLVQDLDSVYIVEYPYISIGSTTGIGTFGSSTSGNNIQLEFYPDSNINDVVQIQSYNEIFYTEYDSQNEYENLLYNPISEIYQLSRYNAINGTRINRISFDMKHQGIPIFEKKFNPAFKLNLGTGEFNIQNHFFSLGEKILYQENSTTGPALPIRIHPSNSPLPSEVYALPIDEDKFKVSLTKADALAGISVTFSSFGSGNTHTFGMEKRNEKTIISIDGVVQQPLTYTPLSFKLDGNVSSSTTFFALSGISSVKPNDIINVDDEYMRIISVGFGTTSLGPITEIGEYSVVNVDRGIFESLVQEHDNEQDIRIFRGSYNITGNKLHFVTPPRGAGIENNNESDLPYPTSSFSGRVYLQKDYSKNKIFDDISDSFDGKNRDFILYSGGNTISGITTGSGFVFINNIFQTPSTANNSDNNFEIKESSGITTITFSGITETGLPGDPIFISDYDVNQNQIPRGGVVVSLGSSSGVGYAPLVGAFVTAIVGVGGSILAVGIGSTDMLGSGYNRQVSVAITDTSHTGIGASVEAVIGVGGTLSFRIINSGGSGYTNPKVIVSAPSYENLPVMGVYRPGVGYTTETGVNLLINLTVSATSSPVGLGSTLFQVSSFSISNPGYAFKLGDRVTPVGLVTDRKLNAPLTPFELTVTEVFTDSFYGLELGEFDYIDSIKSLQNGTRTTFPLYYNEQLRSFEKDLADPISRVIDLESCFLIFINGVLQEPGKAYQFDGGTTITFFEPPKPEDSVSIFFYQGKVGVDVQEEDIIETIKVGDEIQLNKNDGYTISFSQPPRVVENIESSDELATNTYYSQGIGQIESIYRPVSWIKQKSDKIVSGDYAYKSRLSLESLVFPTANIIKNFTSNDTEIFLDNSELFRFDYPRPGGPDNGPIVGSDDITNNYFISPIGEDIRALIVPNTSSNIVSAAFTAAVDVNGNVIGITTTNIGFGYTQSSLEVKFSAPYYRGIGIGTTATATATVSTAGTISSVSITNPGSGYTFTNPPQVIVQSPTFKYEEVSGITEVDGFSGIIVGIQTIGIGASNIIRFKVLVSDNYKSKVQNLVKGYPIVISGTQIGSPVRSLDTDFISTVGIGTTCFDNIYLIDSIIAVNENPLIQFDTRVSYINPSSVSAGINTLTNSVGLGTEDPHSLGKFSWGKLTVSSRANPSNIVVNGFTATSGLSTYPYIQRKIYGLRKTGGLKY